MVNNFIPLIVVVQKYSVRIFIILILLLSQIRPQIPNDFISIKDSKFFLNGQELKFLGINAYYLHHIYFVEGERHIIEEVFQTAKSYGIKVLRTWAFHEGDSSNVSGVIRYEPYKYSEYGLQGLDYVITKAEEYDIKLILTLANNHNDYGGIPQYIEWANEYLQAGIDTKFQHGDFFTNDSLKAWYKDYLYTILNRTNHLSGVPYKNDPTIFGFELINEGANIYSDYRIIAGWYEEMSSYFKSIDSSHLLSTGETGYDNTFNNYSDVNFFYNGSDFLFNGMKGTSYVSNTNLKNIDYGSFHLYTDAWGMNPIAGTTWINDHIKIALGMGKPALLGEFGTAGDRYNFYEKYLMALRNSKCKSALVWYYVHPLLSSSDPYGINEIDDPELFALFKEYIEIINTDTSQVSYTNISGAVLSQNYPNPFNPATTISYTLSKPQYVKLELFSPLGESLVILDEGFKEAGQYELNLSFDNSLIGSGVYFYSLITAHNILTKKLIFLK